MSPVKLHNAIVAVCPITGVSIGNRSDRLTWTFRASEDATAEQIAAAQAIIDEADISILNDIVYISKLTIMDRLEVLGLQVAAITALNSDAVKLARWNAATKIATDDADVIAVLTAIGITDPSTVLY